MTLMVLLEHACAYTNVVTFNVFILTCIVSSNVFSHTQGAWKAKSVSFCWRHAFSFSQERRTAYSTTEQRL